MYLYWLYECFECQCPMDIGLRVSDTDYSKFIRDYGSWCYLRPFVLCHNSSFYKFYGLRLKRVCRSCFVEPKRVNLVHRETGTPRQVVTKRDRSKSTDEIREYFKNFVAFRRRKDLDCCIVPTYKRSHVCCLDLFFDCNTRDVESD